MRTLTIDIGGTGIKLLPVDDNGDMLAERHRELTPMPATPEAVLEVIEDMVSKQEQFDRVSVGFPGVVVNGVTRAYFECPQSVAPGTYDITADTVTTLLNVKRLVGIW